MERTINGLGQLITEAQIHDKSQAPVVNVQYTYSTMLNPMGQYANHSRLTKITYPNGRIVRSEYYSGLDDSISRVNFLADDNGGTVGTHLEEYSYLGLSSIIKRAHPEPGVHLTYIKRGFPQRDINQPFSRP